MDFIEFCICKHFKTYSFMHAMCITAGDCMDSIEHISFIIWSTDFRFQAQDKFASDLLFIHTYTFCVH